MCINDATAEELAARNTTRKAFYVCPDHTCLQTWKRGAIEGDPAQERLQIIAFPMEYKDALQQVTGKPIVMRTGRDKDKLDEVDKKTSGVQMESIAEVEDEDRADQTDIDGIDLESIDFEEDSELDLRDWRRPEEKIYQ